MHRCKTPFLKPGQQPRSQGSLLPTLRRERGWVGENPGNEVARTCTSELINASKLPVTAVGFGFSCVWLSRSKRFLSQLQLLSKLIKKTFLKKISVFFSPLFFKALFTLKNEIKITNNFCFSYSMFLYPICRTVICARFHILYIPPVFQLEEALCNHNSSYREFRKNGEESPVFLYRVKKGTFDLLMKHLVEANPMTSPIQFKIPRLIKTKAAGKLLLENLQPQHEHMK